MTASISWTDSVGAASLGNIAEIPVSRFDGWTPDVKLMADSANALGTGQLYVFEYRQDDLVTLRIDNLKGSQLQYARRLKLHLIRGGEVTVSATNELNELYTTCILAPDTNPTISEPTRENREYSFSVTLKSGSEASGSVIGGGHGVGDCGGPIDDFSPDMIPGMVLWLDPCSVVNPGHDNPISTWTDLSPLQTDVVGSSAQPTYSHDSGTGGGWLPAFTDPNHLETADNSSVDLTGDSTCFFIAKYNRGADGNISTILSKDSGLAAVVGEYRIAFVGVNGIRVDRPNGAAAGGSSEFSNFDVYHLWRAKIESGVVVYHRDGVLAGASTLADGVARTTPIRVGALKNVGEALLDPTHYGYGQAGFIKQILLYNRALSDADATRIEAYMAVDPTPEA